MQKDKANIRRRRLNDFPELQVGFPERNDVSSPDEEIERVDVDPADLGTPGSRRNRATGLKQEIRGPEVSRA